MFNNNQGHNPTLSKLSTNPPKTGINGLTTVSPTHVPSDLLHPPACSVRSNDEQSYKKLFVSVCSCLGATPVTKTAATLASFSEAMIYYREGMLT
jgi:hypothetical protein